MVKIFDFELLKNAEHTFDMDINKGGMGKNRQLFDCELLKDAENVDDIGEGKRVLEVHLLPSIKNVSSRRSRQTCTGSNPSC